MLFLWILAIVVAIAFLKYLYLIIKRFILIRKIGVLVKKRRGSMKYCRNPLISIFKHDGKPDISLRFQYKIVDVSVITTPLRRVRYHFDINNKLMELIIERRSVYMGNPRVPRPVGVMDRVYTIRKYKIGFEAPDNDNQKYVILNPAPRSVTKADRSALTALCDNDDLIPGVKVCGSKWFIENI